MSIDAAVTRRETAAPPSLEAAMAHVRDVVRQSGTSFVAGMRILPRPRREAMFAIYAFCREIDDIADEDGAVEDKRAALAEWRAEIARLYEGQPRAPIAVALLPAVRAYDLPRREFELLIEGMEMDANGPIVAPSLETYFAYIRRVAGAVGLLSMRAFGAPRGETADRFALSLADALQTTNILRDIAEDASLGRLYLPAEVLARHAIMTREPSAVAAHDNLGPVAAELGAMARQRFATVRACLGELDWRRLRPALLMMGIYETYLDRIEARGWDNVGPPVTLTRFEKTRIAMRWALAPPIRR